MGSTFAQGVPYKLLKEFLNRKISVETSTGEVYKGVLVEAEENMSMSLNGVKVNFIDGKTADMNSVYVRGSRIRLIKLPDSAKDSLATMARSAMPRGRGGFRGGFRGGRRGGGGKPSFDRRRY